MKFNKSLSLALSILALAACSVEKEPKAPREGGPTGISTAVPALGARTWLDSESGGTALQVYWSDGDRINVNGQNSAPVSIAPGQKASEAEFLLRSVTPPYRVVYPAGVVSGEAYDANGAIEITIPDKQQYLPGSFGNGAAILCGYSEDGEGSVQMHNLCSAVRVRLKGDASTQIFKAFINAGGVPISGKFALKTEDGILEAINGSDELELQIENAVALSAEGSWFYFAIPAGAYPDGLSFGFSQQSDHRTMVCEWTPSDTLRAGILYSFSNVDYVPGAKEIETPDDWNEFATCVNESGDMSKWVHKGRVRLAADLTADNLTQVTAPFMYEFDGQEHSITRSAAGSSLFKSVQGSIRNLTLEGALSLSFRGASLADTLRAGAAIEHCTNNMTVSYNAADHAVIGGLVMIMKGGSVSDCQNSGAISVTEDLTGSDLNINVGGIVGQVNPADSAVLSNCSNTATITVIPVSDADGTYGAPVNCLGGIAGWLRGTSGKFILNNCDNSGALSYDGTQIISSRGLAAYHASLGGIIGIGSNISAQYGALSTPDGTNGLNIRMEGCDNTGELHNYMAADNVGKYTNSKILTGGIAGCLMGNSDRHIKLISCTNRANIFTYDITGNDAVVTPAYSQAAGGITGFGGYLDISDCFTSCIIGNRKRPAFAYAGAIGIAVRAFILENSTVYSTLNMCRIQGANLNNGIVAACPKQFREMSPTTLINVSPAPDLSGSAIRNCTLGGTLNYSDLSYNYENTEDISLKSFTALVFKATQEVRGVTYGSATGSEVTRSGNTIITQAP